MHAIKRYGVVIYGFLLTACGDRGVEQQGAQPEMMDLGQLTANNVNIIVKCQGQQADISLAPWRRGLDPGETVSFNLRGGANAVSQVLIAPKAGTDSSGWPFNGNSLIVLRGQSTTTTAAPANNTGTDRAYPYSLQATCTFGGVSRDILVDPDLIVEGGGAVDSLP